MEKYTTKLLTRQESQIWSGTSSRESLLLVWDVLVAALASQKSLA